MTVGTGTPGTPAPPPARRPGRLRPGMRVGVVAPSSPVIEPSRVRRGMLGLERLGLEVELGPEVTECYGYLAGRDELRAEGLLSMLERPDIDAVMCLRGGYGAARTVAALDRSRLRALQDRDPKVFIGFSDITVLHQLLAAELGWVTFYGPMVTSFVDASDYTLAGFRRALLEAEVVEVGPDPDDPYVEALVPGVARGPLAGGCLTLLCSLLGTPLEPDFTGKVVFFEDVDAEPYEVDRLVTHLLAAGKLQSAAGILVGEHAGCEIRQPGPSLSLGQVLADLVQPLGLPALHGLPVGHGRHLATLPLGVPVVLDVDAGTLRAEDPAVI